MKTLSRGVFLANAVNYGSLKSRICRAPGAGVENHNGLFDLLPERCTRERRNDEDRSNVSSSSGIRVIDEALEESIRALRKHEA